MIQRQRNVSEWLFAAYYAGTILFVLLDYWLDFNIRLTFLDQWPGWRALYYGFCVVCFLLIWRHPAWSNLIAAGESLVTVSALIISMALKVLIVSDEMIEDGRGAVTLRQLLNFLISGGAAYLALIWRARAARQDLIGKIRG